MSEARRVASDPDKIEGPTPEENAFILGEAVRLETIPNDIRVWDRYLFSKCTTALQAWCLMRIYDELNLANVDYVAVGKWCDQGNFLEKASGKLRESPSPALDQMLEPIEEIGDAFSGPIQRGNLPYDTSTIQEKWFMQARDCAQACGNTDSSRLEKQKAYFALGMIVFGLQQKPWAQGLWGNQILDIWYDMGFAVVYHTDSSKDLQDMYECSFRKDFGVPSHSFEKFYDYWTKGTFAQSLKQWIKTDETYGRRFSPWTSSREFGNLKGFLEARANKREESVWRLCHLLVVGNKKENFLGPGKELFKAWVDYGICPGEWA